jgi:hypothetical protein
MNQLTWDKIPEAVRHIVRRYVGNDNSNATKQMRLDAANEIMAIMKLALEKTWEDGFEEFYQHFTNMVEPIPFETYYKETYDTNR